MALGELESEGSVSGENYRAQWKWESGGGDEGKRQERMPIKSQTRVAYVCYASNSAAPSLSQRGNAHMAVTLPARACCSTPEAALRAVRRSWREAHGVPQVFNRDRDIFHDTEADV